MLLRLYLTLVPNMQNITFLTAALAAVFGSAAAQSVSGTPEGFATGTTGGAAGETVTPSSTDELVSYLTAAEPYVSAQSSKVTVRYSVQASTNSFRSLVPRPSSSRRSLISQERREPRRRLAVPHGVPTAPVSLPSTPMTGAVITNQAPEPFKSPTMSPAPPPSMLPPTRPFLALAHRPESGAKVFVLRTVSPT